LLLAFATSPRRLQQQERCISHGLASGEDANFQDVCLDLLADDNIHLLAAAATDASLNHAQQLVDFGSKTARAQATLELMVDFKNMNKVIMER